MKDQKDKCRFIFTAACPTLPGSKETWNKETRNSQMRVFNNPTGVVEVNHWQWWLTTHVTVIKSFFSGTCTFLSIFLKDVLVLVLKYKVSKNNLLNYI